MEVELKLLLAEADNDKLMHHPLIGAHARAPVSRQQTAARYFDTVDLHLLHQGAGLRVRKMDGKWLQTMKAGGGAQNGLHQRNEWEGAVDRPWPQLGRLRKLIGDDQRWLDALDAPDLKRRLEPLFAVQVERSRWDLQVDGSEIEMVLDHGIIERHGRQLPVNEIELELKSGDRAALFNFALQLQEQIPLRISNSSKAERGYSLCRQTGTVPVKAQPLQLASDDSAADALQAILNNCLDQIQKNESAVIDSDNVEALHQMRVGVRRLRSALKLFESAAPCPPALQQDIAWLGTELGAARDMEVLLTSTLPRVDANPGGKAGLMELQDVVLGAVRDQRRQAAQALLSQRYTRLQLQLGSWMQQLPATEPASAATFARNTMQHLHKAMIKRAGKMSDHDARSVHRLRIAGKRSRYALEFFQSLYRDKGTRTYLKMLSFMQDELGRHNDLAVADHLLQELAQRHPAATPAINFARGYLQALQGQQATDLDGMRRMLHELKLPH